MRDPQEWSNHPGKNVLLSQNRPLRIEFIKHTAAIEKGVLLTDQVAESW